MFKTLFRIGLVVAMATILSMGIRQCSNDLICYAAATSDWKQCGTKVMILNTTDQSLIYNVVWLDHDVPELIGQPMPRCGGELAPHKSDTPSKDFKLCPGRHGIIWHARGQDKKVSQYLFLVKSSDTKLILTPTGVISLNVSITPELKEAPTISLIDTTVPDIQRELFAEEAIKQVLKDNYDAFIRVAKATSYGNTVLLYTSYKDENVLYTMSIRGTAAGILSVDFTKQVTMSKNVVNIYYEGFRAGGYYCYAKQLQKANNSAQLGIIKQSIFEQVIVMLFKKGDTC